MPIDISEEHIASIFRVEKYGLYDVKFQKMELFLYGLFNDAVNSSVG
jgi:hypothetical protein